MNSNTPHLPVGTTLAGGKYRIVRFIGAGGFGCTYEAEFPDMGIRVAIKEFYVSDYCDRDASGAVSIVSKNKAALIGKLRDKFVREAQRLYKMHHPNIVRVSDILHENGTSYYVMDYIDGRSLQGLIESQGPLPEPRALRYIGQVMDALEYVHGNNMLHLDIKPDNIMIDSKDRAILIDFGVSKQYDEVDGHNTSTILGITPGYAPPEQGDNSIQDFTPASDIYALGATLYTTLTGEVPPSSAKLNCGLAQLAPLPADTSPATCNAIAQMMQPNLNRRPQSISAARALLNAKPAGVETEPAGVETEPVINVGMHPGASSGRKAKQITAPKSKKWLWAAIAVVAVVVGVAAIFLSRNTDTDVNSPLLQLEVPELVAGDVKTFDVNGVSFNMVYVEGGTFEMGATAEQSNGYLPNADEYPVHSVALDSYWIGQTEVTQELWLAVMGNNPDWIPDRGFGNQYPAYSISYNDCLEFIKNLNSLTGQQFRMPTEAEWEYAARGGSMSKGYIFSGSDTLSEVGWYLDNSGSNKVHEVGKRSANELGVYDMSGNVWEWCSDWYDSKAYIGSSSKPSTDSLRVYRGGGLRNDANGCRIAFRSCREPYVNYTSLGLRLAL